MLGLILEELGRLNAKVIVLLRASVAPLPVSASINFADRARQYGMPQLVLIAADPRDPAVSAPPKAVSRTLLSATA